MKENDIIEIKTYIENKKAIIKVKDNGPGFPKEIIDTIEPFKTTRVKDGGIGLGLYSVYTIIKKFNGELKIYNENSAVCEIIFPLN